MEDSLDKSTHLKIMILNLFFLIFMIFIIFNLSGAMYQSDGIWEIGKHTLNTVTFFTIAWIACVNHFLTYFSRDLNENLEDYLTIIGLVGNPALILITKIFPAITKWEGYTNIKFAISAISLIASLMLLLRIISKKKIKQND